MSHHFNKKVEPMKIWPGMTVNEMVLQMGRSGAFVAGTISKAVDIYEQMIKNETYIFLSIAGALVPAGLSKVIATLIRKGLVNAVVSTGANLVHDATEAFGGSFYKGKVNLNDAELFEEKVDRIYDVVVTEKDFNEMFDQPILKIYKEIDRQQKGESMSINEILMEVAKRLPPGDSILRACYDCGVPLFAPALSDSVFGLQMALYNRTMGGNLRVDAFRDLQAMWDIREKNEDTGAIILGGGVPKNYIFQSYWFGQKKLGYVIQISLDRPETGGLSGAPPDEAVSWGKIKREAPRVVVVSEVTVALPIIASALIERLEKK